MIKVGSPQFLFMAEAEGMTDLVSTRQTALNAIVNDIHDYPGNSITIDQVNQFAANYGITLDRKDIAYIQNRI